MRPPRPPWLLPPFPMEMMLEGAPVGVGRMAPTVTGGRVPWVLTTTGVVMICRRACQSEHAAAHLMTCAHDVVLQACRTSQDAGGQETEQSAPDLMDACLPYNRVQASMGSAGGHHCGSALHRVLVPCRHTPWR